MLICGRDSSFSSVVSLIVMVVAYVLAPALRAEHDPLGRAEAGELADALAAHHIPSAGARQPRLAPPGVATALPVEGQEVVLHLRPGHPVPVVLDDDLDLVRQRRHEAVEGGRGHRPVRCLGVRRPHRGSCSSILDGLPRGCDAVGREADADRPRVAVVGVGDELDEDLADVGVEVDAQSLQHAPLERHAHDVRAPGAWFGRRRRLDGSGLARRRRTWRDGVGLIVAHRTSPLPLRHPSERVDQGRLCESSRSSRWDVGTVASSPTIVLSGHVPVPSPMGRAAHASCSLRVTRGPRAAYSPA